MLSRRPSRFAAYGIAILSVLLAIALTFLYHRIFGHANTIFAFFYLAVCLSTWYGGRYPGLVTTVLSLIVIDYFFIPPFYSWTLSPINMWRLGIYLAVMLLMNWLTAELVNARRQVEILSQQQVEESEARLHQALQAANMGIWDYDVATHRLLWSPEHERLFGLHPGTFDGRYETFESLLHPDDRSYVRQLGEQALARRGSLLGVYRIIWSDGSLHWIECRGQVICDDQKQPLRLSGTVMDIDERIQAEQALQQLNQELEERVEQRTVALQESEVRYRAIVEDQTELITRFLPDSTLLFVNDAYCRYFGKQREAILGTSYAPVVFEADLETVNQQVQSMGVSNPIVTITNRVVVNGEIRWTQWINRVLLGPDGQITEVQAVGRDISDLKRTEAALRLSEERLKLALEGSGNGLWDWDCVTGEVYLDANWHRILGYQEGELPLSIDTWRTLMHPDDRLWIAPLMSTHLQESDALYTFDYRIRTKAGDWKWVATYGRVVARAEDGSPLRVVGTQQDIGDRKQAEEQLRLSAERISLANAELSRAARLKDEFLANMSHELRTPLNAILGMSEVLEEEIYGSLTEEQQNSVHLIEQSGQHLLNLINDILDLAKVESGKMALDIAPVKVAQICSACLDLVRQQAYQKNIQLQCAIDQGIDQLELDERRTRQVLVNLLSNAIKFTPNGGQVQLSVHQDPGEEVIQLVVADTGIGIPAEQMGALFQPFVQLESSLSRQHSGTGLGLALVRRIVELHGGSVTLESEVGQGSRFTVTLPWRQPLPSQVEIADADAIAPSPLPIQRALIIEDSELAANQVSRYLNELGVTTVVHPIGQGVVELALRTNPDVVVLDILLPDLPGWDVLIQLKEHPQTRHIPVLIVSVVDDRARGLALGAADYLLKPITRMQLHQAFHRLLRVVEPVQKTALIVTHQPMESPLILVVEDNESNIEMLLNYLHAYGLRTAIARNGLEAVQWVKQCSPALVLMDIQMPEMDGLEATRRIRADERFANLPIIALTALAMPGDRERCFAAGANEYLTKPVSLKQLVQVIQQHLPDHEILRSG